MKLILALLLNCSTVYSETQYVCHTPYLAYGMNRTYLCPGVSDDTMRRFFADYVKAYYAAEYKKHPELKRYQSLRAAQKEAIAAIECGWKTVE